MSIKNLPKSLVDSVQNVVAERNSEMDNLTNRLFSEGLKKFGVKKACQLAEADYRALHAWVLTKLHEKCSCYDSYEEDHMPGDDILYNDKGEMKKDLGEEDASDVVKAELEKMGKTFDELSPEEKKDLFNTVDSKIVSKDEKSGLDEVLDLTSGSEQDAIQRAIRDFIKSDAPQFKGRTKEERIDMAIAAVKDARGTSKKMNEAVALDPEDLDTNGAIAVGNAMDADPITADVIRDVVAQGKTEYRLLLQYATGGEIFLGAPYEGTHIYPPVSMPGASSIKMLRDMIEDMPFYNRVVEKALKNALDLPSKNPKFVGNDKQVVESKKNKNKRLK